MPTTLHLSVADFRDAAHWYLRLTDPTGNLLADHDVRLDPRDPHYEAFMDLAAYLDIHTDPRNRQQDEARRVRELGEWMGRHLYGSIGKRILDAGTPAIVRFQVPAHPPEASRLLYRPWELGYVDGQPLALQDVSLVFEVQGESSVVQHLPVGKRLRILAVFSLPEGADALNLRQERFELRRSIHEIGQRRTRAIHLRVLQYGVTREALSKILQQGEGWDIVYFSGHGLAAHLVLEKVDGSVDLVPSTEFARLLWSARGQLKWVTLSACLSAAATVEESLQWLGVADPKPAPEHVSSTTPLQAVAREIVKSMDCAVLAMRYPVGDQFAIDLGRRLFEGVLDQEQSLARAMQIVLPELTKAEAGAAAVSVATPSLFGRYAADLALAVPKGESELRLGLAHFPEEPLQFVGRVGLLSRARRALAPGSGYTGILFHGMSGGGKTASALELAYQYEDVERFQGFVWFKAPEDSYMALPELEKEWNKQLNHPQVTLQASAAPEIFHANLPRITKFLTQRSLLIVLDNMETLQRNNGAWRDPKWERLMAVLLDHRGQSRVVMTSRLRPEPMNAKLLALPVHTLSLQEAALLARQSPNLGTLLRDESTRALVTQTLVLVQGHPELLKLAEAQASTAARLAAHLKAAAASTEGPLEAFFRTGESALEEVHFLNTLLGWTRGVVSTLSEPARTFFHRICCMEERDREEWVINEVWGDVTEEMRELVEAGLADASYQVHPGVAQAGRESREEVDETLAEFWTFVFAYALVNETRSAGDLVLRSGLSAAPYLIRLKRWEYASSFLERVIQRDKSVPAASAVLPLVRRIALETRLPVDAGILGRALHAAGNLTEAEAVLRKAERQAVNSGQYQVAGGTAGALLDVLKETGRFQEALQAAERMRDHIRQASLGPWTQLTVEAKRLQILNEIGRYGEALSAAQDWWDKISNWPEPKRSEEGVNAWVVREGLLDIGCSAAISLQLWDRALFLNNERVRLKEARGATSLELAGARYQNYGPLLALQRYKEARSLLIRCLDVVKSEGSSGGLGKMYSALAELEGHLERREEAIHFESIALFYRYVDGSPGECAISHFNLGSYCLAADENVHAAVAHHLAAAIILYQTDSGNQTQALWAMKQHLGLPGKSALPSNFEELCTIVQQTEGVRFRELFSSLPQRAASGDEAIQKVLEMAGGEESASEMPEELRQILEAAASGLDVEPAIATLEQHFATYPQAADIIAELHRLVAQARANAAGTE
ncbi:MAG TPA: NB-ARC domain-containing protein [Bryobacteraceae bacterium]|jgi:tetratricopeptide (TPR) repeat protein|nr:NB-ARC domain-containing protein [Bryobacteraceae bacterium]